MPHVDDGKFKVGRLFSFGAAETFARGFNWATLAILPIVISPREYGIVGLIVALEAVVSTIALVGQNRAILRYGNESASALSASFIVPISVGILIIVAGWTAQLFSSEFFSISTTDILPLLSISIVLVAVNRLVIAVARARNDVQLFLRHRTLVSFLKIVFVLAIAFFIRTSISYVIGGILAVLVAFAISFPKLIQYKKFSRPSLPTIVKMLAFGWPFIFHTISGNILVAVDRFMLDAYFDPEVVGLYTLAYTVGFALLFVYGALSIYLEPQIYRHNSDRKKYEALIGHYTFVSTIASMAFAVVSLVAFELLTDFLLDPMYRDAKPLIPLVIAGYLLFPIYTQSNYRLTVAGKTIYIAVSSGAAALCNIGLNIILIPRFGPMGAAASTVISYAILSAIIFWLSLWVNKTPFRAVQQKWTFGVIVLVTLGICFVDRYGTAIFILGSGTAAILIIYRNYIADYYALFHSQILSKKLS